MDKNLKKNNNVKEIDFHGAAVIDPQGREIAITEEMIQEAFKKLEELTVLPGKVTR